MNKRFFDARLSIPCQRAWLMSLVLGSLACGGVQAAPAAMPIGCLIEPERTADLGSPAIGVIKSILVERGDHVQKGQVIAVLRDDVERASLDVAHSRSVADAEVRAAQAAADLANQRRKRAIELQGKGFIAQQALEQTVSETRVAEEKLLQAKEQKRSLEKESALAQVRLGERSIRSPFDGVIVERYFSAGERVEEKPMVKVARIDPLRVEVVMPSAMYGSVQVGTEARITPDLAGMEPIAASVALIDKVLDAASSTYRVRLLVPNPSGSIPAGLRCKIEFAGLSPEAAKAARANAGPAPARAAELLPAKAAGKSAAKTLTRSGTKTPVAEMPQDLAADVERDALRKPLKANAARVALNGAVAANSAANPAGTAATTAALVPASVAARSAAATEAVTARALGKKRAAGAPEAILARNPASIPDLKMDWAFPVEPAAPAPQKM